MDNDDSIGIEESIVDTTQQERLATDYGDQGIRKARELR